MVHHAVFAGDFEVLCTALAAYAEDGVFGPDDVFDDFSLGGIKGQVDGFFDATAVGTEVSFEVELLPILALTIGIDGDAV